jgi:hypothetical protein
MRAPVVMVLVSCAACAQQVPLPASVPAPVPASVPASVPAAENLVTGWIEAGYRWQSGVAGSEDTYRSVVNLGSGLKLTGLDLTFRTPHHQFFDDLHVQAYDWPDPYSTLRVDAAKQAIYRFSASYRSLAYFNNLPSYADPLLARGIVLNEQSFDTRRRLGSLDLQLLPSRRLSPYLGFESDSDTGHGVNSFVSGGNEYPVPFSNTGRTRLFRGGGHLSLAHLHLTVEEGGVTYRQNEDTFTNGVNPGNSSAPVLGQTLDLTGLARAYGVRGTTVYTKANLTATPLSWLDVHGQFLYGEGQNTVNYTQFDTGNLLLLSQVLFYNGERFLENAAAKMPHTVAEAGWEIRPVKRVRVWQSWGTDRLHDSGSGASLNSFLANNYNHADTDILADVGAHLALRAGYSHIWGNATDLVLPLAGLTTQTNGQLRRNVLSASATWKTGDRLLLSGEYSRGLSGGTYFRTSLYDYDKARLIARYQVMKDLHLHLDYLVLSNRNPLAGSPYRYLTHQESLSVEWIPSGWNAAFDVSYEHCGYHTEITYIDPADFLSSKSDYRENCHTVTTAITATLPRHVTLKAGGSALVTSGSRPTSSYQPVARLAAPLAHNVSWFAEWRYYGFGETYYQYENFRTHLFTTGLRLSR